MLEKQSFCWKYTAKLSKTENQVALSIIWIVITALNQKVTQNQTWTIWNPWFCHYTMFNNLLKYVAASTKEIKTSVEVDGNLTTLNML